MTSYLPLRISGLEGDPVEEGGGAGAEDHRAGQGGVRGQGRGHAEEGIHKALLRKIYKSGKEDFDEQRRKCGVTEKMRICE